MESAATDRRKHPQHRVCGGKVGTIVLALKFGPVARAGLWSAVRIPCGGAPISSPALLRSFPRRQVLVNSEPDTIGQSEHDGLPLSRGLRNACQFRFRLDVMAEHCDRSK